MNASFKYHYWLASVLVASAVGCGRQPDPERRVTRSADGYLIVLREGDDALSFLSNLASEAHIEGATFSGFGFGHVTFGYFDQHKKDFERREFREVEVASLTGSIAWKNGAPALHAHAVAADRNFAAFGGHLLGLQVGRGSLELHVVTRQPPLSRQRDEAIGADVLVLPY